MTRPRLALTFSPAVLAPAELPRLIEFARVADEAGIDAVRIPEHVVIGRDTSAYAWGDYPYAPEAPWLEPLTTLAAIAAVTERVALITGILIAPLRPAVILAKQAATVDVLSASRLVLGVGTGWQPAELEAAGVPFRERGERLTETIAACRALWRHAPASFAGRWTSFDEVWCEPRPARPGGIPVWFAGSLSERMLQRLVALGDGWMPVMGTTPAETRAGVQRLEQALLAGGRSLDGFGVATFATPVGEGGRPSLERTLEAARGLADDGVTMVSLYWPSFVSDLDDVPAWIARAAAIWGRL